MSTKTKRIAITFSGGYVPGLNAIIKGTALAAGKLDWELVGIRDGFDGLLFPERYPEGGLMPITPGVMRQIGDSNGCILGTAAHSDPFHVRTVNADNILEETDRSDELIEKLKAENIDSLICVVGTRALSILWKLNRKGLNTVCIPKSIENDVEATSLSFGFNSSLNYVTEILGRALDAARSARQMAVVEVPGLHSGWLALQSAIAVCADAVLIPEVKYDIRGVAKKLQAKADAGGNYGLVIVAEGARASKATQEPKVSDQKMKQSLSPGATGDESEFVIEQSGKVAKEVAFEIQRLTSLETYPIVIGALARGGSPSVTDRQLGVSYGAAAVRCLSENQAGVLVAFEPPKLIYVPLTTALNKYRTLPSNSVFVQVARSLDISLGEKQGELYEHATNQSKETDWTHPEYPAFLNQ
jgi:6-phosphofructokinase 1